MKYLYFGNLRPFSKLLFFGLISVFCFLFSVVLASVGAWLFFGVGISDFQAGLSTLNPENIPFIKFSQALQTIGLFVLPPIIAGYLFLEGKMRPLRYLRINKSPVSPKIGYTIALIVFSLPAVSVLGKLNSALELPESLKAIEISMQALEEAASKTTKAILVTDSETALVINLIIVAVLPAIGEEFFFRGVLQRIFGEWFKNMHLAVFAASAIFSFIHFQFYGFIPRLLLGMLFGYLFVWTKNLWYPIVAHFVNNAIGVTAYFFYPELENTALADEIIGEGVSISSGEWITASISLLLSGLMIFLIIKKSKK